MPGQLARLDNRAVLVSGQPDAALLTALMAGPRQPLQLYFGFSFAMNPLKFFFPAHIITDRGVELDGMAVVERIAKVGQLYPRDEVSGWTGDGSRADYFVRDLELSLPLATFVSDGKTFPGERLYGAFDLTELNGVVITPGGRWLDPLPLSIPTHQLQRDLPPAPATTLMRATLDHPDQPLTVLPDDLSGWLAAMDRTP